MTQLFWDTLSANPSYISHGGPDKWQRYISGKITGKASRVYLYEEKNELKGFTVVEITEDGDKPFGIICDLLVEPGQRKKGIGKNLLSRSIEWLETQGISDFYLESGIQNHNAHAFFERLGFRMVSHVFRLKRDL